VAEKGYISEVFVSFQGEGAHVGRRHLFVRLAGCNLRCSYCDTPDSLERTSAYKLWANGEAVAYENPISATELGGIIRDTLDREPPIDAVALTGGEPLVQAGFLRSLLAENRFDAPVLLETNGVLPNKLLEILEFVDIISMDLKLPSNTGEGSFWSEHARFLDIGKDRDLYVKMVVDDGTAATDVEQAIILVSRHAPAVDVYLQPMVDALGRMAIGPERLDQFYKICRKHVESLRILPQTHKAMGLM
jgi:organic radical activating enzyme